MSSQTPASPSPVAELAVAAEPERVAAANAGRVTAGVGVVADVAGIVAFLLAGVKIVALVLGAVAVLLGVYLIVRRWGKPLRLGALGAVLILAVGTGIIGVVAGHNLGRAAGPAVPSSSGGLPSALPTPSTAGSRPTGVDALASESATTPQPAGLASASSTGDLNTARAPVNLGDSRQGLMTNANGFGPATQLTINAKAFDYGLSGCRIACSSATSDFNLGRSFSTFTARLGVLDSSRAGGSAHIQILADGKTIESKVVQLGVSYDLRLPMKEVLRLQFVESNDAGVIAAVGDPTVAP